MTYCSQIINDSSLTKIEKFDSLIPLKISYIGVISSNKGADLFIPIVSELLRLNICFELHLCGTPRFCKKFSEDEFNKLISIKNVKFYGKFLLNKLKR